MSTLTAAVHTGGRRLARSPRRDQALIRWLEHHPDSEAAEAAVALGRGIRPTHRRLRRLEREGRVQSAWISDEVFNYLVYRTPEATP